jgi:ribosomal protein S12 methylthiotransferase accessory factor
MILNFKNYDPQEIIDEIFNLEDIIKINDYIGVILEQTYTMLEFKIQIHLLLEDYQEVYDLALYSQNKLCMVIKELLALELHELEYEDYEEALFSIFTKEVVLKAQDIIQNKDFLIDTTMDKQYLTMLKLYDEISSQNKASL